MQIAGEINAFENVPQEGGLIVDIKLWIIFLRCDDQILGKRELPLSQNRIGICQQFLRCSVGVVGNVAFAADCKQQRMHACFIDGMN